MLVTTNYKVYFSRQISC